MCRHFFTFCILVFIQAFITLQTATGQDDMIRVTTHDRQIVVTDPSKGVNPYRSWGLFPSEEVPLRKIVMTVEFGCPDTMRCADWDYSDRISIKRAGGVSAASLDYEIGRMLTPYGGAFSRDWKFKWTVDVTDFSLLLRDSVEIEYNHSGYEPNNDRGWAITVGFDIFKGQPAFKPVSVQKIYDDNFAYGDSTKNIEEKLAPVSFSAAKGASFARLRVIQTGHGMDEPDGCGEFCSKVREVWFNGKMIDSRPIWKKCGNNPLYPQAGTWLFDRANWCPGDLIQPDIFDLSLDGAATHTIDFRMEPYVSPKPSANEVISAYLIQYEKPVAVNDVALEDIIVPSSASLYQRVNPATANPEIVIRNNGSAELKSLQVNVNTNGFPVRKYKWEGSVLPGKTANIVLHGLIDAKNGTNIFNAELIKPNGRNDAYAADNKMKVTFTKAPVLDSLLVFYLLTNIESGQNEYSLKSWDGTIISERLKGTMKPSTAYTDTFRLDPGAYTLELTDSAGDGLEFWYNTRGGRGVARLMDGKGNMIRSFESDCGAGWIYSFTVGPDPDPVSPEDFSIGLFPTRTRDKTVLDYFSNKPEDVTVRFVTDPGGITAEEHIYHNLKEGILTFDLSHYQKGRFYVKVIVRDREVFNKRLRFRE